MLVLNRINTVGVFSFLRNRVNILVFAILLNKAAAKVDGFLIAGYKFGIISGNIHNYVISYRKHICKEFTGFGIRSDGNSLFIIFHLIGLNRIDIRILVVLVCS